MCAKNSSGILWRLTPFERFTLSATACSHIIQFSTSFEQNEPKLWRSLCQFMEHTTCLLYRLQLLVQNTLLSVCRVFEIVDVFTSENVWFISNMGFSWRCSLYTNSAPLKGSNKFSPFTKVLYLYWPAKKHKRRQTLDEFQNAASKASHLFEILR